MLKERNRSIKAMAGVVGMLAGALVMIPGASQAAQSVPAAKAGDIEVWGSTDITSGVPARTSYSAGSDPWAALALGTNGTVGSDFGITKAGTVQRLAGTAPLLAVPADLGTAKAISTYNGKAAVVTSDGSVRIWGETRGIPPQTITPAALGVGGPPVVAKDVSVGSTTITILLADGRVGLLTSAFGYEIAKYDGVAITNATKVQTLTSLSYVLLSGGGVIGFDPSGPINTIPAAVTGDTLADPVVDFAVGAPSVAVTQSGAVHTWGVGGVQGDFPTGAVTGKVIKVAASTRYAAALTDDNEVVAWGQANEATDYPLVTTIPAEVNNKQVADLVGGPYTLGAIVTVPLGDVEVSTPASLSGTAKVGSTLTGTPATFTGSPDAITNAWLANDVAISGATGTTYKLTAAEEGKNITFESTATRAEGSFSVKSTSTPLGPVLPGPIASKTVVGAPSKAYGTAGTATVTVSNTGGRPVAGTVTLTGAGAAQTKALVSGKATFALAKNLAPKAYTLSAKYNGSADLTASTGAVKYTVAKGKVKAPTYKTSKTPTSKKAGKGSVTVTAPSGLAKASGKVTITIKGKSKKTIKTSLSGGKKTFTLPKLKKGTYKVTVSYAGDKNYGSAKSKTYTLKIKK